MDVKKINECTEAVLHKLRMPSCLHTDARQEAWVAALDPRGKDMYLAILRHLGNWMAKQRKQSRSDVRPDVHAERPSRDDILDLRYVIGTLSEQHVKLLYFRYWQDMSHKEVAVAMEMPYYTSTHKLSVVIRAMRARLQ